MQKVIDLAREIAAKTSPGVEDVPMPKPGQPIPVLHYPVPGFANGGKTVRRAVMAAKGKGGSTGKQNLPMDAQSREERAAQMGFSGPWYHGSARLDRVVSGDKIDPKRATSGPMPFFTDNPAMASNYATGKQDTSLSAGDTGETANYFTVHPKDLGFSGRNPIPVEKSWHYLPPHIRSQIAQSAMRVGYQDQDAHDGDLVLHPDFGSISSPDHYAHVLKEHRGNHLAALRDLWVDSGTLHGEEDKLAHIYRLAGYPHPISQETAPWVGASGVLPAKLQMKNPLRTSDTDYLHKTVIPHLERTFKNDRTRKSQYGADMWDKNHRYTPKEWTETLKQELARGANPMVFTSIPDKVTNALRALGHDGIIDTGGKQGGEGHTVAIPFDAHQVRSQFAKFDPKDEGKSGFSKAGGGSADWDSLLRRQRDVEGLKAAIRDPQTGEIHYGHTHKSVMDAASRHPDAGKWSRLSWEWGSDDSPHVGFVTQEGDFLTRDEANDKLKFGYTAEDARDFLRRKRNNGGTV